jgi:lipoic acid synthetase
MSKTSKLNAPSRTTPETHQRGESKVSRIPVKVQPATEMLRKPAWIRTSIRHSDSAKHIKGILRDRQLHSVCEEAACPNLGECFHNGTATFMIMGDICTRRCPFCDVAHGRPLPPDPEEPEQLARAVQAMGLRYVVITSVDRDDLPDGGAAHYGATINALRRLNPETRVEILVPDFRGRMATALEILDQAPPDVFNHNLETVPRLYRQVRPGADYRESLELLQAFKQRHPGVPTKSGLMLGLGEEIEEVETVLRDLRAHGCEMLTLGQYLQPSRNHLPVARFVTPEEFEALGKSAEAMGFSSVASAPMVRSSYHADLQADPLLNG